MLVKEGLEEEESKQPVRELWEMAGANQYEKGELRALKLFGVLYAPIINTLV